MSNCPHNENNAEYCVICLRERIAELEAVIVSLNEIYPKRIAELEISIADRLKRLGYTEPKHSAYHADEIDRLTAQDEVHWKTRRTLLKRIAELEDPDWQTYIAITTKWLEKYPPDIFTGVSGDSGPLFVVAVRKALAKQQKKDDHGTDCDCSACCPN